MTRENEDRLQQGDECSNMWTAPAPGPSPALEALNDLPEAEVFSLSDVDREEIRRRSEIFERRSRPENGQIFLP